MFFGGLDPSCKLHVDEDVLDIDIEREGVYLLVFKFHIERLLLRSTIPIMAAVDLSAVRIDTSEIKK